MNKFEHNKAALEIARLIVAKLQQENYEKALMLAQSLISEIEDLLLDD